MDCWAYLDLPRNTVSDKVIRDKSFAIASNPQYDRYQRSLASKFDKKPINRKYHKHEVTKNVFSKHVWVIPLKYKKGETTTKAFQKILKDSGCKPKKTWVD